MRNKIIVALDVESQGEARKLVNKLLPAVKIFKVGSVLFTRCGPAIVNYIHRKGGKVFLDLKFHDIPNTIASAVRQAVRLKVNMMTLHIRGEREMLEAAVSSAREESRRIGVTRPGLIGVTVLTSQRATGAQIRKLAALGKECGLDGVVCSVKEAAMVRKECGDKFFIITPGIRPQGCQSDDQKRIATAQEAFEAGADFIVVGRPIIAAENPRKAIENILFR